MKKKSVEKSVLVLFSGGQDSTTCLAWAKQKFTKVQAIAFDYGQRHKIELKQAKKLAKITKTPLHIEKLNLNFGKNALTNKLKIIEGSANRLPSTFVPGRNLIFLSVAAIHAQKSGITELVTGVCQTDYSGYPDCRAQFIRSLEKTLTLAMNITFKIHTPLMWLTKAATVKLMQKLDMLELLKYSHTCYKGLRPACGTCPSCRLRLKGFREADIKDPLKYA